MKPAKRQASKGLLFGTLLLLLLLVVNSFVLMLVFKPIYYDVAVGEVATEDIVSPNDAVDYASTDAARQAARDAVEPILRVDDELVEEQLENMREEIENFDAFMQAARQIWDDNAIILSETRYRVDMQWTEMLTTEELAVMLQTHDLSEYIDTSIAYLILNAYLPIGVEREPESNPPIVILEDALIDAARTQLESGLDEDELEGAAIAVRNALPDSVPQIVRSELAYDICVKYMVPTWTEDLQATEQARVAAAEKVPTVRISQNEVIIAVGDTITEDDIATLTSLNLIRSDKDDGIVYAGIAVYTVFVFAAMWFYLIFYERDTMCSARKMLSLSLIYLITMALCYACTFIEPRISPVLLVPLLAASLHDRKTAMATNILAGLGLSVMMGADYGTIFNEQSLVWAAVSIVMGQFAIALRERDKRRSGVLLSGLVSGAIGGLTAVSWHLIIGDTFINAFISFGFVFLGSVIATIISLGLTVVFEMIFDLPTDARLNELLNTNHTLLKRMMSTAPGTYHHCMMAAQLAENAAEAVGANSLLAKVGATYHDVGKLRRPHMFSENQGNAPNPHDTLPPIESAQIIIAHQQDAEAILAKFHIPAAVRQIAKEHHGNTLVAYFYNLVQKQMDKRKVSEELFRYDAPKPSMIESAIVMMADSCEAAVRSLHNPTPEEVSDMVKRVIKGKMDDGQFSDCDITLKQLSKIEESFFKTFKGIMHDRISYAESEND